jgi:hypothetical protein
MKMAPIIINHILNPRAIPKHIVAILSYLAICLIFIIDVEVGYQESLQVLYFIPLFMIAFYGEQKLLIAAAVLLSILLQAVAFLMFGIPLTLTIIEILIVIFTNITVTYLSQYARHIFLADTNKKAGDYYGPERRKANNYYWPERRREARG